MPTPIVNISTVTHKVEVSIPESRVEIVLPNQPSVVVTSQSNNTVSVLECDNEVRVLSVAAQGPSGADGQDGMLTISEDTSPELGGDLSLGSFNIIGQVETPDFIIDGGLL